MPSFPDTDKAVAVIRSASTSTEARFVDIGDKLESAIGTIGSLRETFDVLAAEMRGESLRETTQELLKIMPRLRELGIGNDSERAAIGQLDQQIGLIHQRIVQMSKAVDGIRMLSINARIEAVSIGDAGLDFASFTSEIGRTLRLAQNSLTEFTVELQGVGSLLHSAAARQIVLGQQQSATMLSIPAKLSVSVGAITDRGKRAGAAATAVAKKSEQVGQRISAAVMALQIGDTTRQRLEHVDYALSLVADILSPSAAGSGDWTGLSEAGRRALVTMCCKMQAAQLIDTADEYDREIGQILSSLKQLSADAEDILRLGDAAVGGTGERGRTFVSEVEDQVAAVSALLDGFGAARREADQVATSVSDATARLVSHTRVLKSLEEDIRIMGLNTTLKCGRLGTIGRPLLVVAQELRSYSNQIAAEAGAVTEKLDSVMTIAAALSGGDHEKRAADLEVVATGMSTAVSRLRTAGQSLADALGSLARDTSEVGGLLRDTVERAQVHEELSHVLRQSAAELRIAGDGDVSDSALDMPETDRLLALLMRCYTMDQERIVHDRHSHGRASAMVCKPAAAASDALEDVFF